jgi:glycosyltransferase involved in cell wall biosynthesis
MERPKLICLTPVFNEAWILERFLKCTSVWADHIIIADQQSTDGSREIAHRFPKVTLIENPSEAFNEPERQQMLIAEARRIDGPRILLALDADEFITANFFNSPEWETILRAPPGTVIRFQWQDVLSDGLDLRYFRYHWAPPIGYVDDGAPHQGRAIHSVRVPVPAAAPSLMPTQIKVMHYCMADLERFKSKIRWYQCFEHINLHRKPLDLYRFYHENLFVSPSLIQPVPKEWIQDYERRGIDMSSLNREGVYRWDREVLQYFQTHGTARFKRLALWDVDWNKVYNDHHPHEPQKNFPDPRNRVTRLVHRWLRWTQPDFSLYAVQPFLRRIFYRFAHRALRLLGW